ncbi:germinal-center associated nuclear protein [Chanos chanos]|uniref:Germinal-center associated nuclear protein n=1 Tax=Chanos chanos TaxID=29144 RepID=A0A6J2WIG7_CHACN|nr:germinal-center associated nuclear protein [Chanos chanos]
MNPSHIFGTPQSAFQAPNSNNQSTGIFQSFGQQDSNTPTQNVGFAATPTFSQPSAFSQPSGFGPPSGQTSVFGQASSFGQKPSFGQSDGLPQGSGQSSTFPSMTQTSAFGAPAMELRGPPSFATSQPTFGSAHGFAPNATFSQPTAFRQQATGFGLSTSTSQGPSSSSGAGQSFGSNVSSFAQQPAPSQPSGLFSTAVSSQSFGTTTNFKPANEALFKPIFNASPEPTNPQPAPASVTFSSTKTSVSVRRPRNQPSVREGISAVMDFSFSQPAAAPSISASGACLQKTETTSNSSSSLQFTFSQPANPSSSTSTVSKPSSEPVTPFSFNFAPSASKSGFASKPEASQIPAERGADQESAGAAGSFGSLGKGMKRKEESADPAASQAKAVKAENTQGGGGGGGAEAPRHPPKRPLLRMHPAAGGGVFRSVLSGLMKSAANQTNREHAKEAESPPDWSQPERPDPPVPVSDVAGTATRAPAPAVATLDSTEKSTPEEKSPIRRSQRTVSTDSLGGLSPSDSTAVQCKNIPADLNTKDIITEHFSKFGKVCKVLCRPKKDLAIVHFQDHASASKAKKRGKNFHRHEIQIFWHRKKQSPGDKAARRPEGNARVSETSDARPGPLMSSPLRNPPSRSSAVSSTVSLSKGSPIKKPTIAKTLQFDSDPQQHSGAEGQSSDRPVTSLPSSLLPLIGQVAETSEEKYRLLEMRDKILRQGRPKRTDLDLSKVFVGTCPDMCPEKERYMRETRNQLSTFELVPDTEKVDHCAAIKEYSRSSADQEEPLPHELRPLPVLSMTMDYLVTQIMDQGEGNYRDWYDFVWNRTRGIRKDITQQHLCDPVTVSLIEKCMRFHIHCAHHLCQEPMMSFDAKINNENMTKCLQSLKEMYQDLATRGVYCSHEAEFRQYSVLLKLNDGDILREVQQFREEVRNSPEVKFAVQAFAALNSNNFVRFFKLVNSASYLASCILHRYFNQVRREALRALNIAYTVGSQRSTAFPIEDVVRMLMFRNASEASDFVQQYGLNVTDGMVELSRTAYQEPELSMPERKSVTIEKKRTVLIGEVVNGGPLPNPPHHTPVCSFDSQHRYRGEEISLEPPSALKAQTFAQRQEGKTTAEALATVQPVNAADAEGAVAMGHSATTSLPPDAVLPFQPAKLPTPPPKPEPVYSDEDIMAEVDSVVDEVILPEIKEVATAGAEYVSTALSESGSQLEAIVSEVLGQMLREVSTAEIEAEKNRIAEEKRKMEEARRKQEREAFLNRFSEDLCSEISEEVLLESIKETAGAEIQQALEEKAACIARCSEEECDSLIEEALSMEITQIAQEVLDVELRRIRRFLKRWRDVVAVRRQLKRQMRGFPAAPCCVDPRFKVKAFAPSAPTCPSLELLAKGLVHLGNAGLMTVSCTRLLKMRQEAVHQMKVHFFYSKLLSERVWSPLDLPSLVAESFPCPPERIFWKAALLLPSNQESDTSIVNRVLTAWLEAKLGGEERMEDGEKDPEGKLQTLSMSNGLRDVGNRTHKVHVCVKVAHGPLSEEQQCQLEEQKELLGTSALVIMLPALFSAGQGCQGQEEDVPLLSALLQLKQVQQASGFHCPLPLAVIVPVQSEGTASDQTLEEGLRLKMLVEDGLISEYTFIRIPETTNDMQGSEQVSDAVRWLVSRCPAPSVLTSQTLVQFVESGLCQEFSSRLYHDKQNRAGARLPSQDPAPIIELYNSVLSFLANLVSSEHLSGLSWPPSEFSVSETRDLVPHLEWNSPQHLAWLRRTVLSLQLPVWDLPPVHAAWSFLRASIFQYVSQIPTSPRTQPLLMSRLENLLERVRSRCVPLGSEDDDDDDDDEKEGPTFFQIPWDDIVVLCVDHRLRDWKLPEYPMADDALTDDGEILVYFHKDSLKRFQPPVSWIEAVKRTHQEKREEKAQGDTPRQTPVLARRFPRQRLFQSLMRTEEESASVLDITHTPSPQELLPHRVLSGIQQEKAESKRFEEQLQRWLDVDPLTSLSMPLFLPSTLLSVPEILTTSQRSPAASASLRQEVRNDELVESASSSLLLRGAPVSIAKRLKDLDRLISANREEELACCLKLSSLLDIVED